MARVKRRSSVARGASAQASLYFGAGAAAKVAARGQPGGRRYEPARRRAETSVDGRAHQAMRWDARASLDKYRTERRNRLDGQCALDVLISSKESKPKVQLGGSRCKAQSAMQGQWSAPQTRGTATALAVARSGKQNLSHANALWPACRAH